VLGSGEFYKRIIAKDLSHGVTMVHLLTEGSFDQVNGSHFECKFVWLDTLSLRI